METFRTKSYTASFTSDQSNHNDGFGTAGWERHFPVVDRLSPTGL